MPNADYYNQTAARTLAVLDELSRADAPLSLAELTDRLSVSKSSLFPIIRTIEAQGFIRRSASGGYILTPRLLELAAHMSQARRLQAAFDEASAPAVTTANELMLLTVLDGDDAVCVSSRAPAEHLIELNVRLGKRIPAHATAYGKALLAGLGNDDIYERIGQQALKPITSRTIASLELLLEDLDRVRQRGVAEDWREAEDGVASVAAPIKDGFSITVASVGFTVSTERATPEHWDRLRRLLFGTAAEISSRLGNVDRRRA